MSIFVPKSFQVASHSQLHICTSKLDVRLHHSHAIELGKINDSIKKRPIFLPRGQAFSLATYVKNRKTNLKLPLDKTAHHLRKRFAPALGHLIVIRTNCWYATLWKLQEIWVFATV